MSDSGDVKALEDWQVQPLLASGLTIAAAGVDVSGLGQVKIRIRDFDGSTLGQAASNTIFLDADAAGWGWFVDSTPGEDSEFIIPGDQAEQGRIDLLSAVMHELGHLLGFDHDDPGLMQPTLAPGTRPTRAPTIDARVLATLDWIYTQEPTSRSGGSHSDDLVWALFDMPY